MIVPNDSRVHVLEAIETILSTPGRTTTVKCIYTDNAKKDGPGIRRKFEEFQLPVLFY